MASQRTVDHSAIRVNQAFTITLLAIAFVTGATWLLLIVGAVMLISALAPAYALFTAVYRRVLRPAGIVKPDVIRDNPEPHRFAQLFGGTLVTLTFVLAQAGAGPVVWALPLIVIALASLNLFAGWCAGCMVYYWLNRLGVPGFTHSRIGVSH
ncbi:MAG TPA: DUF4395 domain-containing protein [Aggregatilinea sp.]|uniref:DUF4395 domain-containing protein n=1 Tax=Aggregatilinea sp. TaxID=2806333 RepID=UPI002B5A7C20|nr:DUF4395 domain-containing protein [Aggregatilinea sp.]HML24263.1 DUF4395 domain-containing protein [Aggregatilinea sp.]